MIEEKIKIMTEIKERLISDLEDLADAMRGEKAENACENLGILIGYIYAITEVNYKIKSEKIKGEENDL